MTVARLGRGRWPRVQGPSPVPGRLFDEALCASRGEESRRDEDGEKVFLMQHLMQC